MVKKTQATNQTVVIYDVGTGNWEFNVLKQPLIRSYTQGLTSIVPATLSMEFSSSPMRGHWITRPMWHEYVLFGLKLLGTDIKAGFLYRINRFRAFF